MSTIPASLSDRTRTWIAGDDADTRRSATADDFAALAGEVDTKLTATFPDRPVLDENGIPRWSVKVEQGKVLEVQIPMPREDVEVPLMC